MRYYAVSGSAARQRTDCAIVGLYESGALTGAATQLDAALGGRITRFVKRGDARGKAGEVTLIDGERGPCERVLLVGLGKKVDFGRKQYKKALLAAAAALAKTGARDALSYLSTEPLPETDAYYRARLAAESVGSALYRIPAIRSTRKPSPPALRSFGVAVSGEGPEEGRGAWPRARSRHRGRRGADPRPREPARERLHAILSRASGARPRTPATPASRRRCSTKQRCGVSRWGPCCPSRRAPTSPPS